MIRLFVEKMLPIQSKDGVLEFQLSLCGIFILIEVSNHFLAELYAASEAASFPGHNSHCYAVCSENKGADGTAERTASAPPPPICFHGVF